MKTNQTFSVNYWLYKSKTKNGLAPIYCRITINGVRTEISVKRNIDPTKWNSIAGIVKGNSEEARTINHYLEIFKSEIFKIYTQLTITKKIINPNDIKNELLGIKEERRGIIDIMTYHNEQMFKSIGIEVVKSTYVKFETVKNKLQEFIKEKYNKKNVYLEELDLKFIADFEYFLKVNQKISHNTVMKYIRNVKKVMNMAVSYEWIKTNPFALFKCSTKKVKREILFIEEINRLREKKITIERIDEVRDIFLFCCYTGYAFSDVFKLRLEDVNIGIDGNLWILTERKKTGITSNVPLLPQAQEIINKYKNHFCQTREGKLLPVKSNQKMNVYLKELAAICEINKNLTMHIARHTFATTVTLANNVPIESVSKMLGHSKITTTQIYAKVLDSKVGSDMSNLAKLFEKEEIILKKSY
jgi:site-specific recombinase XerD